MAYRALLSILPRAFRDEFTEEMIDGLRRSAKRARGAGVDRPVARHDSRNHRALRAPAARSASNRSSPLGPQPAATEDIHPHRGDDARPRAGSDDGGDEPGQRRAAQSAAGREGSRSRRRCLCGESRAQPPRVPVERAQLRRSSRPQAGTVGVWRVRADERDHRRRCAAAGRRRVGLGRHVRRPRHLGRARPSIHGRGHAAGRAADVDPWSRLRQGALRRRRCGRSIADGRRPIDGDRRRPSRGIPSSRRAKTTSGSRSTIDAAPKHAQPNLSAHDGPSRRRRDDRHRRAAHEPGRRRSREAVSGQQRRLSGRGEARRGAADAKRAPDHHRPRPGRDRDLPARLHQHRQPRRRSHRRASIGILGAHRARRQRSRACRDSC